MKPNSVRPLSRRLAVVGLGICMSLVAFLPRQAAAAPVPWGAVLVPGWQWAGAVSAAGDLNVYSNGNGSQDRWGSYGMDYECVELITRYAQLRFGDHWDSWHIMNAYEMWNAGPNVRPVPFTQLPNGGAVSPQFGDILVFGATSFDPSGHVAIVSGAGPGYVNIVEQNWANYSPTGTATLPISGTTMPSRWGLPILGWLRAAGDSAGNLGTAGNGGYALDGYGGLHPYGSALPTADAIAFNGVLARGVACVPKTSQCYVLDGWGGVHATGGAPPVTAGTGYWPGWDIARGLVLTADHKAGFVLDGWGAVHPFAVGGNPLPPPATVSAFWFGWDIATGIAMLPGSSTAGYVLDGWGGVHPFGGAAALPITMYWYGWNIARGIAMTPSGTGGWVVDGWNGLHAFGTAAAVRPGAYFPFQDVARGITAVDAGGGYTVTAWGRVREFGTANPVSTSAIFNDPVARGVGS